MQKVHSIRFFLIPIGLLLFTHFFTPTIYAGDHPCMVWGAEAYPGECMNYYNGKTDYWWKVVFLLLLLSIPVIFLARRRRK